MRIYLLQNFKYISVVQVLMYYERVLDTKIRGRPRQKVKSAYHCLIHGETEQAEHFRKQFEESMRTKYSININSFIF